MHQAYLLSFSNANLTGVNFLSLMFAIVLFLDEGIKIVESFQGFMFYRLF